MRDKWNKERVWENGSLDIGNEKGKNKRNKERKEVNKVSKLVSRYIVYIVFFCDFCIFYIFYEYQRTKAESTIQNQMYISENKPKHK